MRGYRPHDLDEAPGWPPPEILSQLREWSSRLAGAGQD
jgi:hypothetical protein